MSNFQKVIRAFKIYIKVVGWMFAISLAGFALIAILSPSHNVVIFLMLTSWSIVALPPIYSRFTKKYGVNRNIIGRIAAFALSIVLTLISGLVFPQANSNATKSEQLTEDATYEAVPLDK
jgi:hypothetical protein